MGSMNEKRWRSRPWLLAAERTMKCKCRALQCGSDRTPRAVRTFFLESSPSCYSPPWACADRYGERMLTIFRDEQPRKQQQMLPSRLCARYYDQPEDSLF